MADLLQKTNKKLKELIKSGVIQKGDIKDIQLSTRPTKKLMVELKDGSAVHFGQKGSITYLEGASEQTKAAYRARASKIKLKNNEYAYKQKFSPAFLSFYILWT